MIIRRVGVLSVAKISAAVNGGRVGGLEIEVKEESAGAG